MCPLSLLTFTGRLDSPDTTGEGGVLGTGPGDEARLDLLAWGTFCSIDPLSLTILALLGDLALTRG